MLHVWLRSPRSPLAVWHADRKEWYAVAGWQQLQETYQGYKLGRDKTLCLYFPSNHVLQVTPNLDSAQLKQLGVTGKQYLFEEMSLTPADQLAVRQVSHANVHHLYALAQSDIESWQQSATLAGFQVHALLPDFLLLPPPTEGAGQQVMLYQDASTTLLRYSVHQGMAVSYLPLITERLPQLSEICVLPAVPLSSADTPTAELTEAWASAPVDAASTALTNDAITALALDQGLVLTPLTIQPMPVETPERHALNFFTKVSAAKLSPYLRVAMMVGISALVLQMVTDGLQVYRYDTAADKTQAATAAQYQDWFPNEPLNTRIKLQTQLQPKLSGDSAAGSMHMAVLARVSPLIKQSSLQASALNMQPSMLSFTLMASDRDSLDQFTSALTQQGLSARLERVNRDEQGQFSGQVTVDIVENSPESTT